MAGRVRDPTVDPKARTMPAMFTLSRGFAWTLMSLVSGASAVLALPFVMLAIRVVIDATKRERAYRTAGLWSLATVALAILAAALPVSREWDEWADHAGLVFIASIWGIGVCATAVVRWLRQPRKPR